MFFQCHCTCAMLILFFVSSAIFFAYVENRATASCPHRGRVVVANRAKRDYGAEDAAYADAENGRPDYRIYDDGETVGGPDHRADDGCPPDGDTEETRTVRSYALCATAVFAFVACNVFPECCLRKRIRLAKSRRLTVRKVCGCVTVYGEVGSDRERTAEP